MAEEKTKKTHAIVGKINFVLQGCVKLTRANFDKLYGDSKDGKGNPTTYWQLKEKARNSIWEGLQVVLIQEGYKTAKESKES